ALAGQEVPGALSQLLGLGTQRQGVADGALEPDLNRHAVLLDHPFSHMGTFDPDRDAGSPQHVAAADTGPLEQEGRLDRAGGEDDFLAGGVRDESPSRPRPGTDDALAVEAQGAHRRSGGDGQVLPAADRPEEGVRGALADAVLDRRRREADLLL